MEISKIPQLKVIILDSKSFETGTEFTIDHNGLDSNHSEDGTVKFGSDSNSNQVILSNLEKGVGSEHFIIKHDKSYKSTYVLSDLGNGTGTFIRIEKKLYMKTGNIISFGDSHMLVNIENCEKGKIQLKFIDGPMKNESL